MFCRNCGTENDDNAKFCRSCGQPIVPIEELPSADDVAEEVTEDVEKTVDSFDERTDSVYTQEIPPVNTYTNTYSQDLQSAPQQNTNNTIGALVLGIISIVCCCSCIVGLGCGIAAIVMATSEKKKGTATSMTTVALILGIVGVALSVIGGIFMGVTGALEGLSDGTFFDRMRYGGYGYWS